METESLPATFLLRQRAPNVVIFGHWQSQVHLPLRLPAQRVGMRPRFAANSEKWRQQTPNHSEPPEDRKSSLRYRSLVLLVLGCAEYLANPEGIVLTIVSATRGVCPLAWLIGDTGVAMLRLPTDPRDLFCWRRARFPATVVALRRAWCSS